MNQSFRYSLLLMAGVGFAALAPAATTPTAATAAAAKGSGTNQVTDSKAPETPEVAAVRASALADELAVYGLEHNDPVALIQAAKIKNSMGSRPLGVTRSTEGGNGKADGKTTGRKLDAQSLLARAEQLGGDNAAIKGLIADARSGKSRGANGGPKVANERVLAGGTDSYVVNFVGGQPAAVAVVGDGDTDLDLFVYDENGNLICSDRDYTDRLLCRWNPRWTGPFKISIKNYGNVYNVYRAETN